MKWMVLYNPVSPLPRTSIDYIPVGKQDVDNLAAHTVVNCIDTVNVTAK